MFPNAYANQFGTARQAAPVNFDRNSPIQDPVMMGSGPYSLPTNPSTPPPSGVLNRQYPSPYMPVSGPQPVMPSPLQPQRPIAQPMPYQPLGGNVPQAAANNFVNLPMARRFGMMPQ